MPNSYEVNIQNPDFEKLGYIIAIANVDDKHDPSAPTNYHWKILKCRYGRSFINNNYYVFSEYY